MGLEAVMDAGAPRPGLASLTPVNQFASLHVWVIGRSLTVEFRPGPGVPPSGNTGLEHHIIPLASLDRPVHS